MKPTPYRTAKVIHPYTVKAFGYLITVPVGATVCNQTACGNDDAYRFWIDFRAEADRITGVKGSILAHDLTHYGINVPAEYCEAWKAD